MIAQFLSEIYWKRVGYSIELRISDTENLKLIFDPDMSYYSGIWQDNGKARAIPPTTLFDFADKLSKESVWAQVEAENIIDSQHLNSMIMKKLKEEAEKEKEERFKRESEEIPVMDNILVELAGAVKFQNAAAKTTSNYCRHNGIKNVSVFEKKIKMYYHFKDLQPEYELFDGVSTPKYEAMVLQMVEEYLKRLKSKKI